jgi:hypothetical protein
MAQIAATEANAAIVERWRLVALKALFAKMVARNRILNVTEDISEMGDILHVKINPSPTVGDITAASGAFTAEAVTITNVDLTVNKWKYVAHDVVDIADVQSDIDLIQNFSQAFVPALGEQIESDIFALQSSATANDPIGLATGTAFGTDLIVPSGLVLDDLNIPIEDRSWFLAPVCVAQLLKDDKWVDADKTGLPKSVRSTGFLGLDLYGVPAYRSTKIASSGTPTTNVRKVILTHKEGLMVGIQRNIKMEKFARTQFSTPFAASVLYGAAICRNNHVQVVNAKSTLV